MKSSGKAINRSGNTNPFNHEMSYIKLYTSLKDGNSNKDEFGQLINTQYLDDVFNSATVKNWVRKVRIQVGHYIYLREVKVLNYEDKNVALGKTADQSSTLEDGKSNIASLAVDDKFDTFSHTDKSNSNDSKYHIQPAIFPSIMHHCNSLITTLLCFYIKAPAGGRWTWEKIFL